MRPAVALLLPAALSVAGCSEPPPQARNMSAEEVAGQLSAMRIEPGLWELSSEVLDVQAAELPREIRNQMIGPRSRVRHCITAEQAERPSANFLAGRADSDCSYSEFVVHEGNVSGLMSCPGVTATMRGRYQPTAYETRMTMESPVPGGATMTLEVRARGRRIGDCEEGDAS